MRTDIEIWLNEEGKAFLRDIGIKKGQSVLDFGCGAGHYTIPAAKVVEEKGRVYALDKEKKVLDQLMQTAETEGLENIVPMFVQSEELEINLEDESIDAMLIYDVLHYMEQKSRRRVYKNAHRVLGTDAMLSVYPKHCKSDEPLWNLADMELEDVIEDIEGERFCLEKKLLKKLIHDENFDKGYILNYRKRREG
jgi:ubiquinone/menaquinone biosynthesis C-methylase UbiE